MIRVLLIGGGNLKKVKKTMFLLQKVHNRVLLRTRIFQFIVSGLRKYGWRDEISC